MSILWTNPDPSLPLTAVAAQERKANIPVSPNPCYGLAMRLAPLAAFAVLAGCQAAATPADPPMRTAQVVEVIDGDTFNLNGETIRIENIDTPEKPPRAQCIAEVRLAAIAERELVDVLGFTVAAPIAVTRSGTDRYGRTIAKVTTFDGTDVGTEMISRGVAEPWTGRQADWCGQPS